MTDRSNIAAHIAYDDLRQWLDRAEALGDVHVQHVWRFLRAHKSDLSGRKS